MTARVQLALEGMTCAGCATRIEKKLNTLDGVDAAVNLATEEAAVRYDTGRVAIDDLIAAVESAGYRAGGGPQRSGGGGRGGALRAGLPPATAPPAPPAALALPPPLQFEGWEW